MIKITIDAKPSEELAAVAASVEAAATLTDREAAAALHGYLAEALAAALQGHWLEKDARGSGPRRSHFWATIARAAYPEHDASRAQVKVADARLAIHIHGGTVTPKEADALTIPVHEEAKGRRASTLERELNIKLFPLGKKDGGDGVLAADWNGKLTVFYALRTSADIPADPSALPAEADISAALQEAADLWAEDFEAAA